jgi:hypothetical protein
LDRTPSAGRRRVIKGVAAAGLIAAGAIGGGIAASTLAASADPTTTPTTSSTASSTPDGNSSTGGDAGRQGIGGSKPVHSDEKPVSAADEATLKAAALKAVPGGTVVRIETDSGDAAYEAHMTKADGTVVTVKFDANKALVGVEDGMGK